MESTRDAILERYEAGETPLNIALMHLLMNAAAPDDIDRSLAGRAAKAGAAAEKLADLSAFWRDNRDAWTTVRNVLAEANGAGSEPAAWAQIYDRLASVAPEAAVALYGLGSPDLLRQATAEVATFLRARCPTGPDRALVEIGCGYGRLSMALADDFGSGLGLDVSAGMIAEAHRRATDLPHLRFETTDGTSLAAVASGSADLVLAADVFPYLVGAGAEVARAHILDAGRILRSGGTFAIFNYSYRGDDALDRADVQDGFVAAGLRPEDTEPRPFRLWDATVFLGRKA